MYDFIVIIEFSMNNAVIQIKDDQIEDCNHRITQLLCCRSCGLNAQICQICVNKNQHQNNTEIHTKCTVDEFKRHFSRLQEVCSRETEHFVRQINETYQEALESIKKKKAQSLLQLQTFKNDLMKNTYSVLKEKFKNLYEKWKNQRFDTLKCNQIYWVMTAPITSISIKRTEINKNLQKILKNFQNFKPVARNIDEKTVTNKEKIKQAKLNAKDINFVVVNKDNPPVRLPQVDYSEEKDIRIRDRLNLQIKRKQQEKKHLTLYLQNLKTQIQQQQKSRWLQRNRLSLVSKLIDVKSGVQDSAACFKKDSAQKYKTFQINQGIFVISNININSKQENVDQTFPKVRIQKEVQVHNQAAVQQQNSRRSNIQEQIQHKSQYTNEVARQTQLSQINRPGPTMQQQYYIAKPIDKPNQFHQQKQQINLSQVKLQYEPEPHQQWENKYLIQQIRKNGTNQQNCLKIQSIERLLFFKKKLSSPPRMDSKKCKKSGKHKQLSNEHTINPYSQVASQLFEKILNKKVEGEGQSQKN